MRYIDRWDSLIQWWCIAKRFKQKTGFDWQLIKAQMIQESSGKTNAVSNCGAIGLLQIMPATGKDLGVGNPAHLYDPDTNLAAGISYLIRQYEKFPEIPDPQERMKYALAAYNAGRGTVNRAIKHEIIDNGRAGMAWQKWVNVVDELPEIQSRSNAQQTTHYVAKIIGMWQEMQTATMVAMNN